MTREETGRYANALRGEEARQFSFVMDAKSIITFPAYPTVLPDRGWWRSVASPGRDAGGSRRSTSAPMAVRRGRLLACKLPCSRWRILGSATCGSGAGNEPRS